MNEYCFVGLSSAHCAKCAKVEEEYANADFAGAPLLRIDIERHKHLLDALMEDGDVPPAIPFLLFIWDHNKRKHVYKGEQTSEALTWFARRKAAPLLLNWTDLTRAPPTNHRGLEKIAIVGYFHQGREEALEHEDFEEAAKRLQFRHDLDFYQVGNFPPVKRKSREESWFPPLSVPLPAVGVLTPQGSNAFVTLAESEDIVRFIQLHAKWDDADKGAAAVAAKELNTENFLLAEQTGLPMLLLFSPRRELLTNELLRAFHAAAKEFKQHVVFLYDAKQAFADKMHVLGLNGRETMRLQMAINAKGGVVPFPRTTNITRDSFRVFCMDFLAGRIKLVRAGSAISSSSTSVAAAEEEESEVKGVSESIHPAKDLGIEDVSSAAKWSTIALDETKDVLVFVHRTHKCKDCRHVAPYFKKIARRFLALRNISQHHVICAALDLDLYHPDTLLDSAASPPALLLLPAYSKLPPHAHFSAVVKVFSVMEWVREHAARSFTWNQDLPQFDEEEKELFRVQIRAREEEKRQDL